MSFKSIHTDSLTHERHIGDDSITHNPSPRKNVCPDHPFLMRLNVSQPDCIVCNGGGGEPEESIQKETKAIDDTSEPWMQSHVQCRATNKRSSDEENTAEPSMHCQVPHP